MGSGDHEALLQPYGTLGPLAPWGRAGGHAWVLPDPTLSHFPRKRRGAINSKQLTYLEKYRPKQRLRFKDPHTHKTKCCVM